MANRVVRILLFFSWVFVSNLGMAGPKESDSPVADFGIPQVKFANEQIRLVWSENHLTPVGMASALFLGDA